MMIYLILFVHVISAVAPERSSEELDLLNAIIRRTSESSWIGDEKVENATRETPTMPEFTEPYDDDDGPTMREFTEPYEDYELEGSEKSSTEGPVSAKVGGSEKTSTEDPVSTKVSTYDEDPGMSIWWILLMLISLLCLFLFLGKLLCDRYHAGTYRTYEPFLESQYTEIHSKDKEF